MDTEKAEIGFTCCRTNKLSSYFCIICYGAYHPSCVARKSGFGTIDGYKIICSKQCRKKLKDDTSKLVPDDSNPTIDADRIEKLSLECSDLRNELIQVQNELKARDLDMEGLNNKWANKQGNLTEQITQISIEKKVIEKELETYRNELDSAKNELNHLEILKKNLLTSIETLTVQNSLHLDEIRKLKNELCVNGNKAETEQSPALSPNAIIPPSTSKNPKHQILLFGNKSCVSGIGLLVKSLCRSKYDINCQYSDSKVPTETLVNQFAPLSRNFTKNDFVVLFSGMVNALQGKIIDDSCWDTISEISIRTNLIIVTPPYCANRGVLNNFIYKFNLDIRKCLQKRDINCSYLSCDSVMSAYERTQYGFLNYEIKRRLSKFICNELFDQEYNSQNFSLSNDYDGQR